jgi:predicted dehydrogenase
MAIRVGILGFAHGHVGAYCSQWRQKPEFDISLVAGWDHNAQRLHSAVNSYGIKGYSSADDLLSGADVQAVVVASETSMHADLVEKAAAAGKTIVVQKPMALTMKQADRIVDAVKRHEVPFSMAWQMRTDPQNIKMKELIQSGELGKIFMVRRRHGLGTHLWAGFADTWHAKPELNRDIWADDSSHAIDFILWLLGVPESATAELMSLCDPRVPNDNGIVMFRYAGGPLAEVVCSFTTPALENTTEVVGEKGSIVQNYGDAPSCNVPRPADACGLKWYTVSSGKWTCSDIPSPSNHGERISGLSGPLSDFLHGKRPPIATVEEGRMTLRMTLACYVSSREGRRVNINDKSINEIE